MSARRARGGREGRAERSGPSGAERPLTAPHRAPGSAGRPRTAPLPAGQEPAAGGESRAAVPHRGGEGTSGGEPRVRSAPAEGSELPLSRSSARPSLPSGGRAAAGLPARSLPVPSRCCCCPPTFRNFCPPEAAADGGASSGKTHVPSATRAGRSGAEVQVRTTPSAASGAQQECSGF